MKEKIIEILESYQAKGLDRIRNVKNLSGWISPAGIPLIADELEPLINQEVEKRIKERIDRFDVVYDFGEAHRNLHLKTQKLKWSGALWMFEWLRSRLTCSEKPNNSEGGEG